MTGKRKTGRIFEEKHSDYLIEHCAKTDRVIATELNSLFDEVFEEKDVALQRAELKLPPPDREKALALAIQPGKPVIKPQETMHAPLESKEENPPSEPAENIQSPDSENIKKNFAKVSKDVAVTDEKPKSCDFNFTPVFVTRPDKGKVYIYPGIGPVVCDGEQTIPVGGMQMKVISFTEVHAEKSKKTIRFDPAKIAEKQIRELATPKDFDSIFAKLTYGKAELPGLPRHSMQQKEFYERTLKSPNLADIVNLLCYTFKHPASLGNRGSHAITYGNQALDLIAAEYTSVSKSSLKLAKLSVEQAVGKPTLDELTRYNNGQMRSGPA